MGFRGERDDNQVISLYDTADRPEHSTNPTVGSWRTGGHSSRTMSSTACHGEIQQPQRTTRRQTKGGYRGRRCDVGEVSLGGEEWTDYVIRVTASCA